VTSAPRRARRYPAQHQLGQSQFFSYSPFILQAMSPPHTWMIVEPLAGDRVEENLNPVVVPSRIR